eukprot:3578757-Rhodomonas_salina.2
MCVRFRHAFHVYGVVPGVLHVRGLVLSTRVRCDSRHACSAVRVMFQHVTDPAGGLVAFAMRFRHVCGATLGLLFRPACV